MTVSGPQSPRNIWIHERGAFHQFTFDGAEHPIWSPDGTRLVYYSPREASPGFYWQSADGSGEAVRVVSKESGDPNPNSWASSDHVASYEADPRTGFDVWVSSLMDGTTSPFVASDASERAPVFSPDGDWIAYVSDESGVDAVYVKHYPDVGTKHGVSTGEGPAYSPIWAPDGRELFYVQGTVLMSLPIELQPTFRRAGRPTQLFVGDKYVFLDANAQQFDIHPDGDRFLMLRMMTGELPSQIQVVLNWFEEVERLAPAEE